MRTLTAILVTLVFVFGNIAFASEEEDLKEAQEVLKHVIMHTARARAEHLKRQEADKKTQRIIEESMRRIQEGNRVLEKLILDLGP